MRKELDDYLVKRYPEMFSERNGNPSETNMNWGFQCNDGWFNILNNLCLSIEHHIMSLKRQNEFNKKYIDLINENKWSEVPDWIQEQHKNGKLNITPIPEVIADGVKEKFGVLRFSHKGGDQYISGIINMASNISAQTCEMCGKPGELGNSSTGWIRALCDEHNPKNNQKNELEIKSRIKALDLGKLITLEIINIINEKEVIGTLVHDGFINPKDKNKPIEYFNAKKIETEVHSYWEASPLENT